MGRRHVQTRKDIHMCGERPATTELNFTHRGLEVIARDERRLLLKPKHVFVRMMLVSIVPVANTKLNSAR
jgi:hypothetical protein